MLWLRELGGVIRALPKWQRHVLSAATLGLVVAIAIPFAQIRQLSLIRGSDNTGYYFWLRSAMVDGDWDFTNDVEECNTLTEEYRDALRRQPRTETNRQPNKYSIGWALLSTPFYLLADGMVAAGRAAGIWQLSRDGYNEVYQIVLQLGQLGIGLAGLLLAWRCVSRWCGDPRAAFWGVVLVFMASPQLYYLAIKPSLSHSAAFSAIAFMAWASLDAEDQPGRWLPWFWAGVGWGLAVLLRFQLAVFALLPFWVWLRLAGSEQGARLMLRSALCWVAGSLPLLLLQAYAWHVVYGHWLVFTYGENGEGFNWTQPEIIRVLFSPFHGLFYWHPLLAVGAIGLLGGMRRSGGMLLAALLGVGATVYINASWWCWWFASSFGSRAFDASVLFFMAGVAMLLVQATAFWRRVLWVGAISAGIWNYSIMVLFIASLIERNAPVTWIGMLQAGLRMTGRLVQP